MMTIIELVNFNDTGKRVSENEKTRSPRSMNSFQWQDSYSVGVAALDEQHKVLIDLINRLDKTERETGDLVRRVIEEFTENNQVGWELWRDVK